MRTLAWNCRGASRAPTIRGLRELICESTPKIVFLSETKSKSPRINKIKSRLKFANYYCVELVGRAGGLALFWSLGVELEVVYSNKNMITAFVYSDPPNSPWLLFAIYGPYRRNKRIMFWEMLKNMVLSFSGTWIVIGDLNCIKRVDEKKGGCSIPESSINCLRNFMANTGAIDLSFNEPSFTWSNWRAGLVNIKECLDQCLCDQEWQILFLKAGVKYLSNANSNHNPILLDNPSGAQKPQPPF